MTANASDLDRYLRILAGTNPAGRLAPGRKHERAAPLVVVAGVAKQASGWSGIRP